MNDYSISYEFNLSYGAPRDERLLMAGEFDCWPLSDQEYLVRSGKAQATAILKKDVVVALGLCDRFRSLDEHVTRIIGSLPHLQTHRDNVQQVLSGLVEQGFLIDAEQVRRTLAQAPDEPVASTSPIESLFIRTCGRRQCLRRLLDKLAADPYRLQRYIVLDDSPDPNTRCYVEELVVGMRAATGLPLIYFGMEARRRFTAWLANRLGLEHGVLDWLWMSDAGDREPGYGIGLNLALALSAGRRFALIDDDAVPVAYAPPNHETGVRFSSLEVSVRCHKSHAELLQGLQQLPLSPVQEHDKHLGCAVGRYVGNHVSLKQLFQEVERNDLLKVRSRSRVKITVNGLYGDPGTFGMGWVYHADSTSHSALVADESGYDARLGSRQVWKGRGISTLLPSHTCALMTTTLTGIDNTELLLPTLPHGRGEDAFLGTLVGVLYPHSLQLELPWALLHQPEEPRRWDSAQLDQPEQLPANLYLADRLSRTASGMLADDPVTKVQSIRACLLDLISSEEALRADLQYSILAKRSFLIQSLNDRLRQYPDAPEFWRRDVLRMIKANANAGLQEEEPLGIDEQLGVIRYRAGHFAAALDIWSAVWECCRATGEASLLDIATRDDRA